MTLEQLEAQRHQALAHLNVTRRARNMVLADIQQAKDAHEVISPDTYYFQAKLRVHIDTAVRMYTSACQAVDDHRARLAGLKVGG